MIFYNNDKILSSKRHNSRTSEKSQLDIGLSITKRSDNKLLKDLSKSKNKLTLSRLNKWQ